LQNLRCKNQETEDLVKSEFANKINNHQVTNQLIKRDGIILKSNNNDNFNQPNHYYNDEILYSLQSLERVPKQNNKNDDEFNKNIYNNHNKTNFTENRSYRNYIDNNIPSNSGKNNSKYLTNSLYKRHLLESRYNEKSNQYINKDNPENLLTDYNDNYYERNNLYNQKNSLYDNRDNRVKFFNFNIY